MNQITIKAFSIFLASILFSCHTNKEMTGSQWLNENSEAYQINSLNDLPSQDDLIFSIKKTPCFGKCPIYAFSMYNNGLLTYEGMQNVDMIGLFKSIGDEMLQNKVLEQAKGIDFFSLNNVYPSGERRIVDLPNDIIYLAGMEDSNEVVNRNYYDPEYPEEKEIIESLDSFAEFLEGIIKDYKWEKVELGLDNN